MTTNKMPLNRLKFNINQLNHTIQVELNRIKTHRKNLERFLIDPPAQIDIHRELTNSSNTLRQLQMKLRQIKQLRLMCIEDDLFLFDLEIEKIHESANEEINSFLLFYNQMNENRKSVERFQSSSSTSSSSMETTTRTAGDHCHHHHHHHQDQFHDEAEDEGLLQLQMDTQTINEDWNRLAKDIESVCHVMEIFNNMIVQQGQTVNSIQENIETVEVNVENANNNLRKALSWKTSLLPIGGAVLGCAVAGPVGLYFGAKLGACVGLLGGTVLGATGGSLLKKTNQA